MTNFSFRYIVLHSGTSEGLVDGASLVFKSGNKNSVYHYEISGGNFEKWLNS